MTHELRHGQVWVPTKGTSKPRIISDVTSSILKDVHRIGWKWRASRYPRYVWPWTFQRWIARTGAVMREASE